MNELTWIPLGRGFALGASLIIAIGAQNAFVLRQGLLRRHVVAVVTVCALSDALLITAGVAGAGAIIHGAEGVLRLVTWAGAGYLGWFAFSSLRRAVRGGERGLEAASTGAGSLTSAIVTALSLTYLNPHVYLDTVVLLGSVGAREHGPARVWFAAGAVLASVTWFFGLGFGARLLAPIFTRPTAWRILDGVIGMTVLAIAVALLL